MLDVITIPKEQLLTEASYDQKTFTLTITFAGGNQKRYLKFPLRLWKVFKLYVECDGSVKGFMNEYIKGQFVEEIVHEPANNINY